jgi:FkbM family methyltransferase
LRARRPEKRRRGHGMLDLALRPGAMNDLAPFGAYNPTGAARWIIERTQTLPRTWVGRRLYTMLRHVGIRLLNGVPIDVERLGAKMRLYPYTNICDKKVLFAPQFFDPDELAILKGRIHDGFTFIDVGANIGAYSLFVAARAGPNARILAVEPQPAVFDRLVYNIRQNPFGTVKAVACAVADKPGELTLFLDARNSGESSVKIVGSNQDATVRVPATTLLQLATQEGFLRIDAIKLDVEGAEDLILEPFFRDAPASLRPSLMILEKSGRQWQIDLPKLLTENGYRLLIETRLNLVFERP